MAPAESAAVQPQGERKGERGLHRPAEAADEEQPVSGGLSPSGRALFSSLSMPEIYQRVAVLEAELRALRAELVAREGPSASAPPGAEQPPSACASLQDRRRQAKSGGGAQRVVGYAPLGLLRSCFKERNGTPRQGLHAPQSRATLTLSSRGGFNAAEALEGLAAYSHVWLIFDFHANTNKTHRNKSSGLAGEQHSEALPMMKSKVKPPQLGGGTTGLFATRTPHRPNPVGLSLCILDSVDGSTVSLRGVDLIDGTPVLDIKPYHPMDCMASAEYPDWVSAQFPGCSVDQIVPALRVVEMSNGAKAELRRCVEGGLLELYTSYDQAEGAIIECIRLDMRRDQHRRKLGTGSGSFGFCFDLLNVTFDMTSPDSAIVTGVEFWPLGKEHHFKGGL